MNNVIKTQKLVLNTLKLLNEEVEENKYYTISPAEYLEVMKFAGYNGNVFSKLKKYEGKQLVIDGNVNLQSTPTRDLGNIHTINGSLDISYTQVASIGTINVTGPIRDYNSPREKIRIAQELKRRIAVLDSEREEKTRDINNPDIDEEGIRANVLFEYLKNNGDVKEPDEDELQEIEEIEAKLVELNKRYNESEDPEVYYKISSEISDLEERLEEIKPEIDVYHIEKERYGHYGGLMVFQVLHPDFQNREYTVGTEDEMEEGTIEYAEQMIDDSGIDSFNSSFVENYIDEDAVRELFEDYYENDVRDNPEVYFSEDDYQLTDEQEKRIEELQNYIEELENYISDKEKEQSNLESEIEDPKEYEKVFDEIQKLIDDAEDKKDTAQDELDGIEPDDEPTEEMIEQKVSEMVDDKMRDPVDSLKDWGYEIKDYVDKEALAKGLADSDGWGVMNGYDGNYDSVNFNGNTYYVMRIS